MQQGQRVAVLLMAAGVAAEPDAVPELGDVGERDALPGGIFGHDTHHLWELHAQTRSVLE